MQAHACAYASSRAGDKMRAMHRLVALFVLILLPMQWTYAAVGSYCRHEATAESSHVGHHEHKHEQGNFAEDNDKDDRDSFDDQDCPTCHCSFAYGVNVGEAASLPAKVSAPILFRSQAIPDRSPDNPYRPPLVAGA